MQALGYSRFGYQSIRDAHGTGYVMLIVDTLCDHSAVRRSMVLRLRSDELKSEMRIRYKAYIPEFMP